jgi:ribosomal protein S19E (S16A)
MGATSAAAEKKVPFVTTANRRRSKGVIMLPGWWYERLAGTRRAADWQLALHLIRRNYENFRKPFQQANGVLESEGVSREMKRRALNNLERLGLISIVRREDKSPQIVVHTDPPSTPIIIKDRR